MKAAVPVEKGRAAAFLLPAAGRGNMDGCIQDGTQE